MMDCAAARKYMEEGQFGEGNMRPKIETALSFIGDFSTPECADYKVRQSQGSDPGTNRYRDPEIAVK